MPLSLRSQSWFRAEARFPGAFGAWAEGRLTAPAPCSGAQFNSRLPQAQEANIVCVEQGAGAGSWVGGNRESACVLRALYLWGFSGSREGRGGVSPVYWRCDEVWLGQWEWKEP